VDQQLQTLKRQATATPDDIQVLWKYIRNLERTLGFPAELPPEPLAIVLNDGTCDGDSFFDGTMIPYQEGDTFPQLVARYLALRHVGPDDLDFLEFFQEAEHGWVVSMSLEDTASQIYENAPTGRDSYDYAANSTVKRFLRGKAIKTVDFDSYSFYQAGSDPSWSSPTPEFIAQVEEEYRKFSPSVPPRRSCYDGMSLEALLAIDPNE
jgi:hypothetical protein